MPSWAGSSRNRTVFGKRPFSSNALPEVKRNFNIRKYHWPPSNTRFWPKRAGVKNVPSTKVELSYNRITRIQGLDEFAQLLFAGTKNHQKVFLAIFIELKYAPHDFLPSLTFLCEKYGFSHRVLETVRSKMRRMGIIDHVSRFNKAYGYREGWVFSCRFAKSLNRLAALIHKFRERKDALQERKDKDLFMYIWDLLGANGTHRIRSWYLIPVETLDHGKLCCNPAVHTQTKITWT